MSLLEFVRNLLSADAADEPSGDTEATTSTGTDKSDHREEVSSAPGPTPSGESDGGPQLGDPSTPQTELTDENRVLRLLIAGDGRITVESLCERTGWDDERAQEVVQAMEDDGQVRLLTRGSKTLVCRPGFEPDGRNRLFRS